MILFSIFFVSCATNQLVKSQSATILIKTPTMKFYDKGFISKYANHTQVQIFSAGNAILDMKIYKDRVCSSTFKCMGLKAFNAKYLNSSYEDDFLKKIFDKNEKNVIHRDKSNKILIKIKRD